MGPGGLQDGPRGLGDIPTWPERPQEWRKMLQESSKRRKEEAETAKIIKIHLVFEGFLASSGFRLILPRRGLRKGSETALEGPNKGQMNPRGLQEAPKTAQEGLRRGPKRRPEASGSLPCEGLLELRAKWPPADARGAAGAPGPAE